LALEVRSEKFFWHINTQKPSQIISSIKAGFKIDVSEKPVLLTLMN